VQQKKGSAPKKDAQAGKKDTAPTQGEQGVGDTTTQETPSTTTPQETGPPKWPIIHTGGSRKKAKAHKQLSEYTITEDDVDLVAERVQDRAAEEFEEAQHQ
jgi:NACalpha-BTF3-like transcription factor